MKVLVVVDIQNDFCPGGSLAVNEGDKIIPLVNRLAGEGGYDLVIASKDWHPGGHLSFAANHPGKKIFDEIDLGGVPQILWPVHCVEGTSGAEFHPDLDATKFHAIIKKGLDTEVDSYSAFCDNGGKNETRLLSLIEQVANEKGLALQDVIVDVVGLALDFCVAATARGAAERGLKTCIILDATRAVNQDLEAEKTLLRDLLSRGIELRIASERLPDNEIGRNGRPVERGIEL